MSNELTSDFTKDEIEEMCKALTSSDNRITHEHIRVLCDMALRSIPAEPVAVEQKDDSLPFLVQYRRKQCGDLWHDMAAFDQKLVARRYAENCGKDNPHWEYRAVRRTKAHPPRPVSELSKERIREIAIEHFGRIWTTEDEDTIEKCMQAIRTALRESGDAKDARRIEGLEPPFSVYEDYERGLHIIDRTTRIVLSDSYAYDKDEAARASRMEAIAAALNAALSGATHD